MVGSYLFGVVGGAAVDQDDAAQRIGVGIVDTGSAAPRNAMDHGSAVFHSKEVEVTVNNRSVKLFFPKVGMGGLTHAGVTGKKPEFVFVQDAGGV